MAARNRLLQLVTVLVLMIILSTYANKEDVTTKTRLSTSDSFRSEAGPPSNTDMTCAEASLQMSEGQPVVLRAMRIIIFVPLHIVGIILNTFVIFLVAKYKKLRTLSFAVALQIMAFNIAASIIATVFAIATNVADGWPFGSQACVTAGYFFFTSVMLRIVFMFVFVVDRFLSVFAPYFYPRHDVKVIGSLSIAAWIFVLALNAVGLPGLLDCYGFFDLGFRCEIIASCSQSCVTYYNLHFSFVGFPSMLVPSILYCALYCKARALRRNQVIPGSTNDTVSNEAKKREWRTTVTFFLLFITIFPAIAPTALSHVVLSQLSPSTLSAGLHVADIVPFLFFSLLLISDPILIMRNKDVMEVLSTFKSELQQKLCSSNN